MCDAKRREGEEGRGEGKSDGERGRIKGRGEVSDGD